MMHRKWVVGALALILGVVLAGMPSTAAAELKVGISGYIKLDVQYSDKLIGGAPSPGPGSTPLDTVGGVANTVPDNSQTNLDARQSRLRATFSDEVKGVKLSGRIETDFFTTEGNARVSNSRGLRLRHAFARGDHPSGFFLLGGQYWSLFMNSDIAQPSIIDFNGPAGQLFARQPQLRVGYKAPLGGEVGTVVLEVDIEKHSVNDLGGSPDEGQGEAQAPLFAGKVSLFGKVVDASAGFAVANNNVVLATGAEADDTAWGFQTSAQVKFDVGLPARVFAHYQHIDGLGRLANQDFTNAFLVASRIENLESDGFYVGGGVKVGPNTSVNGVFGWSEADSIPGVFDAVATPESLETHRSIHVNIMHNFWEHFRAGVEYRRFDVEAFNGVEGDVNFVHGAVYFFF